MSCIYQVYTMHIHSGYTMYILGYTWYIHCHGYTMYMPGIYHVYTIHMDDISIWMVYTRHIPGIYQKLGFQMYVLHTMSYVYVQCGQNIQLGHRMSQYNHDVVGPIFVYCTCDVVCAM